jgi:hypothetical protein
MEEKQCSGAAQGYYLNIDLAMALEWIAHMARFAIALIMLILAGPAMAAGEGTARDMPARCLSENAVQRQRCVSYIDGMVDMMSATGSILLFLPKLDSDKPCDIKGWCGYGIAQGVQVALGNISACFDGTVAEPDSGRQAFLSWADRHPEKLNDSAWGGALDALRERWPCK